MLKKIEKIVGLGLVFQDFKWSTDTPDFSEYNVIYGWNGSGKTTLSRAFYNLNGSSDDEVKFMVQDTEGNSYTEKDQFPYSVRVFNEDYVSRNLDISTSSASGINIVLGEENKEAVEKIRTLTAELNGSADDDQSPGKTAELRSLRKTSEAAEKQLANLFRDAARTISTATSVAGKASRNYRKPDAEKDYDKLLEKHILDEESLQKLSIELKQEVREPIASVQISWVSEADGNRRDLIDLLKNLPSSAGSIAKATAASEAIERLQEQPKIASWVEEGVHLHRELGSSVCEYCGNKITEDRVTELANHFNEEDQKLRDRIDRELELLREVFLHLRNLPLPDENLFYSELRGCASAALLRVKEQKESCLNAITEVAEFLKSKRQATNKELAFATTVPADALQQAIKGLEASIAEHNRKTEGFGSVQTRAEQQIRQHYLSVIENEVEELRAQLEKNSAEEATLSAKIDQIDGEVKRLSAEVSSDQKAAEMLTQKLKAFLGRDELSFEVYEDDSIVSYRMLRNGLPAQNLSEGEKTAIAFVYFVVHLEDGHFDKKRGIVVVDDPVSSLDSASMYQAFAFMKSCIRDCRQKFILTHNFEFLKLVLNWCSYTKKRSYLMIKNIVESGNRRAILNELDPTLRDYETEYQFLFKSLKELQAAQDGTIALAYPVPNMARKLWDSFLAYRVPNGKSPHRKSELLKQAGLDEQKLDAIYKFTNDQSHMTGSGLNPSLVPEAEKVVNFIFELMEKAAPEHYAILEKSIQSSKV